MQIQTSIVIACYNQAHLLKQTLFTIGRQWDVTDFDYETIVVDDSSTDNTRGIVEEAAEYWKGKTTFRYLRHHKTCGYSNPAPARNMGYREARGRVIIMQAADVFHGTFNAIQELSRVIDNQYHIAQVLTYNKAGIVDHAYTGPLRGDSWEANPLCFLASMTKTSLMAIGGDDEDFTKPGGDDRWLAMRIIEGFKMLGIWRLDVVGYHQYHGRPKDIDDSWKEMDALWRSKVLAARASGNWRAGKGAWDVIPVSPPQSSPSPQGDPHQGPSSWSEGA